MLQYLGSLDYVTGLGKLERRGRLVLQAYKTLKRPVKYPPTALTSEEEKLLKAVADTWRERSEKPNIYATKERILKWLGEDRDIGLDLLHLESLGLIERVEGERVEYRPTYLGLELSKLPGLGRGASVEAVSALSKANSMDGVNETWVEEAFKTEVLGSQGPTKRGLMLLKASQSGKYPVIMREEAAILKNMPERKSIHVEELPDIGDKVKSVNRLVTRGLIDILPDNNYILTDVGRLIKIALVGVPSGIATPIYPSLVKVLEAIDSLDTDDPIEIVRHTKLGLETIKTAFTIGRSAKYIGRSGRELTASGKAVLEASKLMMTRESPSSKKVEDY